MLAALVALAGVFVATYLALYKLGYIGTLVCAVGSCEVVQTSKWATLLGLPVAVWGVGFYLTMLAICIVGLTPTYADSVKVSQLLVALAATGVVVSIWLTYLELYVIHAICQWCVGSAVIVTILFLVCLYDWREVRALEDEALAEAADALRGPGYGAGIRNTEEVSLRAIADPDQG